MGLFQLEDRPQPSPEEAVLISQSNLPLEDRSFYMDVWNERTHICQCCKAPLYEPLLYMFHHVLEKRKKKHAEYADYSRFRHCKWNIMLLCWQCHTTYENHPGSKIVVSIVDYRNQLLVLLELPYEYDENHIWLKNEQLDFSVIQQLFATFIIQLDT